MEHVGEIVQTTKGFNCTSYYQVNANTALSPFTEWAH